MMSLMQWIGWLILYGNCWFAMGYQYDLSTGYFVNPETGARSFVSAWEKPGR